MGEQMHRATQSAEAERAFTAAREALLLAAQRYYLAELETRETEVREALPQLAYAYGKARVAYSLSQVDT